MVEFFWLQESVNKNEKIRIRGSPDTIDLFIDSGMGLASTPAIVRFCHEYSLPKQGDLCHFQEVDFSDLVKKS